jgi:hypothetical protein
VRTEGDVLIIPVLEEVLDLRNFSPPRDHKRRTVVAHCYCVLAAGRHATAPDTGRCNFMRSVLAALPVAPVSLAGLYNRLRFLSAVHGERPSDIVTLLELSLLAAAELAFVRTGIDQLALDGHCLVPSGSCLFWPRVRNCSPNEFGWRAFPAAAR